MSPEFVRMEKTFHEIARKADFPPYDIQWVENTRNSTTEIAEMVLYVYYGDNKWEYHYFRLPHREVPLANIKVDEFCFFIA